jgi:2-polyprenyl-3-methyl-5-hydroxy-6-metoxy-1,4-benzoquinol methylase
MGKRIIENGQTYYVTKLMKSLEVGNIRYSNTSTDTIVERLDNPTPPTLFDLFGFETLAHFKQWLANEIHTPLALLEKNNALLHTLADEWAANRNPTIYEDARYVHETIACSLYVTGEFKKDGRLGKYCVIDNMCRTLYHLNLNTPIVICDVGAGLGISTLYAAYACPNALVYYSDASPRSVDLFNKLLLRSGLSNVRIGIPPKADVIMSYELVEHIPSTEYNVGAPTAFINFVKEHLNSGGFYLFSSQWNAELKHKTIRHFNTYDFDGTKITGVGTKLTTAPYKLYNAALKNAQFKQLNGRSDSAWNWYFRLPLCFQRDGRVAPGEV